MKGHMYKYTECNSVNKQIVLLWLHVIILNALHTNMLLFFLFNKTVLEFFKRMLIHSFISLITKVTSPERRDNYIWPWALTCDYGSVVALMG